MSDILRLGMAGLGVASTQILPPIAKLPFIKITAAADKRADAVAKFREQYRAEGYTSVEELCASRQRRRGLHRHAQLASCRARDHRRQAQKAYHRRKTHGDELGRMRRHE